MKKEIINIVDKWNWYEKLIKENCPERLLKVAFCLASHIHQVCTIGQCINSKNDKCDRAGWAYPTVEQIKKYSGKSESKVSEYTKELSDSGWIEKQVIQRQSGRKSFYRLTIGKNFSSNKKLGQVSNLVQFASPVEGRLHLPQEGIGNSRIKEFASPVVRDDKHKLETLTETSTKTLTIYKPGDKKNMITTSDLLNSKNLLSFAQRSDYVAAYSPSLTKILYLDINDFSCKGNQYTPELPYKGSCELVAL